MGFDDLVNKGKKLYEQNQDSIDKAIHSEKAEGISDDLLDRASEGARRLGGGRFDEQIKGGRDAADKAIGDE
ncbi:hypothetical protein SAMN04489806_0443 [Paramicrobacterium humi]|uniref:MT0933-like antitoxin protein n=1 Tax=Paramicrobacterium humi TaxID=640635 RepID=A0A1H4J223_9MICO|nr:hypothetical protein [Microbacterium humi]SEB40334.1 hypothetical protein SAMN04489806_0443 [Microbacterium humi]